MTGFEVSSLRILIVGAGAVGGFYGAALARAGADVSMVVRSDFAVVCADGFKITSPLLGDLTFRPSQVLNSIDQITGYPDVIFICTKTTSDLVESIRPAVGPSTTVVVLQNGIGIESPFQEAFPNTLIVGGLAFVCINREGPGIIRHLDYGRLVLGAYPTGSSPIVEQLVALFQDAGIPAKSSQLIETERWKKLVWNAPFNPLSAILNQTTDQLLAVPEVAALCRKIMTEVVAVANAAGCSLSADLIERNIEDTRKMAPYKTSMLLDVENGRPVERVSILENCIAIANRYGVDVPHLVSVNAILKGRFN